MIRSIGALLLALAVFFVVDLPIDYLEARARGHAAPSIPLAALEWIFSIFVAIFVGTKTAGSKFPANWFATILCATTFAALWYGFGAVPTSWILATVVVLFSAANVAKGTWLRLGRASR